MRILTRTDTISGVANPVPRELWIEVTGPAPSIGIAINIAVSTAGDYVRQVAFGANAWHGILQVHLAYESTPGCQERVFFQNWVPDERGLPRRSRAFETGLMWNLLAGLTKVASKDKPRVLRAIRQYTDALQYWKTGEELYALAHLYMGVEAITPVAIRQELSRRGLKDRKALEALETSQTHRGLWLRILRHLYIRAGGYKPPSKLDSWARRELIFKGDAETFGTAKSASDSLEHGLKQHDEVHQLAIKCFEKCAWYLRSFLLSAIPLEDSDRTALLSDPYAKPSNTGEFERQLQGIIRCPIDDIAAPDQAYPYVKWEFSLKSINVSESGEMQMDAVQKITPVLASQAALQLERAYFSEPIRITGHDIDGVQQDEREGPNAAGVQLAIDSQHDMKWVEPVGRFILNCNGIRAMSIYWIMRLAKKSAGEVSFSSLSESVLKIKDFLACSELPAEMIGDCIKAWEVVLQFDEMRVVLAGGATQPEGLMIVDRWGKGGAPLIDDLSKVKQANDSLVEIGKKLTGLLEDVVVHINSAKAS